jgi:hypothetical protein
MTLLLTKMTTVTILTIPDGDTRTVIYKALQSPQFQRELNGEFEVEKIPALIFRHAKGSGLTKDGPEKFVRVEDDKVHERDMKGKHNEGDAE